MAEARHVLTEAWEHVLGAQAKLFLAVVGRDRRGEKCDKGDDSCDHLDNGQPNHDYSLWIIELT